MPADRDKQDEQPSKQDEREQRTFATTGGGPQPYDLDPEPADPRDLDKVTLGTRLRDAAVDPREGDWMVSTNAGEANPHGRRVVAPGIHAGSGTGPVRPGPVSDDTDQQAAEETALTEAIYVDGQPVQDAVADVADSLPEPERNRAASVYVAGEPGGASARAANGTSDTTPATRTKSKQKD
jgi:hypothetical protein